MSRRKTRGCCEQSYIPMVASPNSLWRSGYVASSNCGLIILIFVVVVLQYRMASFGFGWLK